MDKKFITTDRRFGSRPTDLKSNLAPAIPDLRVSDPQQASFQLRHLNQEQLARRWSLSGRTLERWRWLRQGPPYLRIGGRIVYRMEDIESFEAAKLRQAAAANQGAS